MAFKNRKHSKVGKTTVRAFHFRVETTPQESQKLHAALDLGCELRNDQVALLTENRAQAKADKAAGLEPSYLSALDLKKAVAGDQLDPKFKALHSQVRQAISLQVSEGLKRWFDALKAGRRHVRPPGRMQRKHFRSLTYPQYGTAANITAGRLHLSKVGEFKLIGWRKMRGAKKSITVKFKDGHWWAIVLCCIQESDVCRPYKDVKDSLPDAGMDPGLAAVMSDSYGKDYETPKPLKAATKKLRHIQKDVSRKFEVRKALHLKVLSGVRASTGSKAPVAEGLVESLRMIPYSNRLKATIVKLAKAHTKVERVRTDGARKNARRSEKSFARLAVEDHGLEFMIKNRKLAKATSDVAIGKQKLALKSVMGTGRYFLVPNRRPEGGNSQTCLCGESVPKTLKDRWHTCPACGLSAPRDQVSAIIVQHTAFGSVPTIDLPQSTEPSIERWRDNTPGLGVLERAVKTLAIRRGESKGRKAVQGKSCSGNGESHTTEPDSTVNTVQTFEPSVKRPTHRKCPPERNTTGGAQAPSVEVKTMDHADSIGSWFIETKGSSGRFNTRRGQSATQEDGVQGVSSGSTLLPHASGRPLGRGG
jgi:transposase